MTNITISNLENANLSESYLTELSEEQSKDLVGGSGAAFVVAFDDIKADDDVEIGTIGQNFFISIGDLL